MAKATVKARNNHLAVEAAMVWWLARVTRSKVGVAAPVAAWSRKTRVRMPTSRKAEPNSVYRKNLSEA